MTLRPDDPIRALSAEELDRLIDSWADPTAPLLSRHTVLEIKAAFLRARPLEPGEPIPGCGCESCTGIPTTEDAGPKGPKGHLKSRRSRRDLRPAIDVDRARAVPVTEVARRLGLDVNRHGYARCPFHDDSRPSLHLNDRKGRAFCNPCGRSWDGLALLMAVRRVSFADAVRELAA
ncbi:MAG: hypothetical protein HY704_11230 [Gemmatimonadetes bacterium]|nr:hypothetical protein [Gemmatimonadota bacterium]